MNLIEGLKLDISAIEMKEHSLRRADHHKGRAEIYESKVKEIEELQKSADDNQRQIAKTSNSQNPVDSLEASAKSHRRREKFFRFASEHFVEGATYRMDLDDLEKVELAPSRW